MTARPLREALIVFAIATGLAVIFFQLARVVPFIFDNLSAFVAAAFLYLPVAVSWRRHEDLAQYGFTLRGWRRSLAFGLIVPAVVFPLFLVGFKGFRSLACAGGRFATLGLCPTVIRGPYDFWSTAFAQIVVVALPEELFFRGYLLQRLEQAWPPARRWLGGGLGKALLVSAALFALGHVAVDGNPRRLAVFFPGLLFGWMRSATGSIAAGVFTHAASNLFIDALQRTFFM